MMPRTHPQQAHIIALAIHAGGVGKTTTAINLGYALALLGQRVCLVDLDSQWDLSRRLAVEAVPPTLADGLETGLTTPTPITCTWHGVSLDVIPSSRQMANAESRLSSVLQARERRLEKLLRPLLGQYDVILIDCPPAKGLLTVNALNAAHSVIVPVQSQDKAYNALELIEETIHEVVEYSNLAVLGYLITMTTHTTAEQGIAAAVAAGYPTETFSTTIPRLVEFTIDSRYHAPVGVYAPHGKGAAAYRDLAAEVLARIQQFEAAHA